MPRGLLIAFAAVVVIGVAVFEGLRSNRWGDSEDMRAAAARLDRVPKEFGDWTSNDTQLDRKIVDMAEASGYVNRSYFNRKTQERFDVLLLCGPSGPIGAHTPDVCYGGLGYKCIGNPVPRQMMQTQKENFWTARFEHERGTLQPLRVYWAWGVDGNWQASDNPRTDFALRNVLFKLYVVHHENPNEKNHTEQFFSEFLPLVKTALTPDAG